VTVIVKLHRDGRLETLENEPGVRRKRWWTVTGTYLTPQGRQEFSTKSPKKCHLADISPSLVAAVRQDEADTGWVDEIEWTAIGR